MAWREAFRLQIQIHRLLVGISSGNCLNAHSSEQTTRARGGSKLNNVLVDVAVVIVVTVVVQRTSTLAKTVIASSICEMCLAGCEVGLRRLVASTLSQQSNKHEIAQVSSKLAWTFVKSAPLPVARFLFVCVCHLCVDYWF